MLLKCKNEMSVEWLSNYVSKALTEFLSFDFNTSGKSTELQLHQVKLQK